MYISINILISTAEPEERVTTAGFITPHAEMASCSSCDEPLAVVQTLYGDIDTDLLCAGCYAQTHGEAPCDDMTKISDNSKDSNVLANISDLLETDKECAPETFVESIPVIFRHTVKEITDTIDKLDTDIVLSIQKAVSQKFTDKFDSYRNHKLKNRRAKNSAITDIVSMGLSIANNSVMADADKAFIKLNTEADTISLTQNTQDPSAQENSNAILLEKLQQLTQIVNKLKDEVKALSDDNIMLKAKLNPTPMEITPPTNNSLPIEQSQPENIQLVTESPDTGESDSEGFVYDKVQEKKRLRRKTRSERKTTKTNQNESTQTTPANGKSENKSSTDLWVGGVHPSCTVEELLSHITSVGVANASATWLATSNRGSSYKVCVPNHLRNMSLSKETWPEGIICRPFRQKRSTNTGFRASEAQQKAQKEQNQNPRHNFRDQRKSFHGQSQRQPFRGQAQRPRAPYNRHNNRQFNQGHQDRTASYRQFNQGHQDRTASYNTQQSFRIPQNIPQNTQSYQSMWPPLPSKPQQNWLPAVSQQQQNGPWYPAFNSMFTI